MGEILREAFLLFSQFFRLSGKYKEVQLRRFDGNLQ